MLNQPKPSATTTLIAILGAVLLSACSSKPEKSDVQREIAKQFACPTFELTDVEKVDGAEAGNNLYDVAFTYTASIKGGKEVAAKLFSDYTILWQELQPLEKAELWTDDPAAKQAISNKLNATRQSFNGLMTCTGGSLAAFVHMLDAVKVTAQTDSEKIPVPISVKVSGTGRMGKAESGWHFIGQYGINNEQIITSEPVAYQRSRPTGESLAVGSTQTSAVNPSTSPVPDQAQEKLDNQKNIGRAVTDAWQTYQSNGIQGVQTSVQNCYQNLDGSPKNPSANQDIQYCISLDYTGFQLDRGFAKVKKMPQLPYFLQAKVENRTNTLMEGRAAPDLMQKLLESWFTTTTRLIDEKLKQ